MIKHTKVIRLTALDYIKGLTDADFNQSFCKVAGYIRGHAEYNPDAAYPIKDVAELFDRLFDMRRVDKYETPTAGTAGESK